MNRFFRAGDEAQLETRTTLGASRVGSQESVVYVDIGSKAIEPKIARDGIPIGAIPINREIFDDFFGGTPAVEHKIVSQSVPAGTSIAQGTTIHIELAQPGGIPVGVFDGIITALADQPIGSVHETFIRGNTEMNRILARTAESGVLSGADQVIVEQAFASNGIPLTDEPGNDVAAALQTLQTVKTFG